MLSAVLAFSAGDLFAECPISETNPEQQLHVTGRIHFNINVSKTGVGHVAIVQSNDRSIDKRRVQTRI